MAGFADVDATWQWGPPVSPFFYLSPFLLSFFPSLLSLPVPLLGGHGGSGRGAVPGGVRRGGGEAGLAATDAAPCWLRALAAAAAAPCCLLQPPPLLAAAAARTRRGRLCWSPPRAGEGGQGAEGWSRGSVAPPSSPSSGGRELHPSSPAVRCNRGRGGEREAPPAEAGIGSSGTG